MITTQSRSIFESIGVALPERRVTTHEIVAGCRNAVRLPLERLTGIRERRIAGDGQFSIDLAEAAVRDCLERSGALAADIDLIVCTNISRRDDADMFSYEPATSVKLKKRLGMPRAIALDLSNACAGMWTGVYAVDAMLRTGRVGRALVVSGEYISYLIDTAQREIVDFMDPQIASLTLGDAGVAVMMTLGPNTGAGLVDLELYTLGKYAPFCIAKPTDQAHGGAMMLTDAIKVTEAVVPHAARHAKLVLDRNGWALDAVDHVVPHQTSQLTMQEGMREIDRMYGHALQDRCVNNLPERGNTSSNSHFLAIFDASQRGELKPQGRVVCCISGSGQTTGTALYNLDDLPTRLHANPINGAKPANGAIHVNGASSTNGDSHTNGDHLNGSVKRLTQGAPTAVPVSLRFESVAVHRPAAGVAADTLNMLESAARDCLTRSTVAMEDVQLLLSTTMYRSEFVMEPAIAALAAGRLGMNDDRPAGHAQKTLAFDVMNGPVGFLKACFLATELASVGKVRAAMVLASEVENNRGFDPDQLLGVEELASAVMMTESADGGGLLAFAFEDHLDFFDRESIVGGWDAAGRPRLWRRNCPKLLDAYSAALRRSAKSFLDEQQLTVADIRLVLPPQVGGDFPYRIARELGFAPEQAICCDSRANLATSSIPCGIQAAVDSGRAKPGDLALLLAVGAGVQTACALYEF